MILMFVNISINFEQYALLGRLRRVDLIIAIWGSDAHPSVRPSVRPQKVFPITMKFGMLVEVDE